MNDGVPLIPYRTDGYQMLQKDKPPSRRASVEIQWDKVGTEYSVHAQFIILPYLPRLQCCCSSKSPFVTTFRVSSQPRFPRSGSNLKLGLGGPREALKEVHENACALQCLTKQSPDTTPVLARFSSLRPPLAAVFNQSSSVLYRTTLAKSNPYYTI